METQTSDKHLHASKGMNSFDLVLTPNATGDEWVLKYNGKHIDNIRLQYPKDGEIFTVTLSVSLSQASINQHWSFPPASGAIDDSGQGQVSDFQINPTVRANSNGIANTLLQLTVTPVGANPNRSAEFNYQLKAKHQGLIYTQPDPSFSAMTGSYGY